MCRKASIIPFLHKCKRNKIKPNKKWTRIPQRTIGIVFIQRESSSLKKNVYLEEYQTTDT
jgi:hypothetical protein